MTKTSYDASLIENVAVS